VCIIGLANGNPTDHFSWLEFGSFVAVFLTLFYLNIFILIPRFLLKKKFIEYAAIIVFIIILFIVLYVPSGLKEEFKGVFWLFFISNIAQIGFVIAGTSAFVLFQHWARNERYIAKLEAATLQAELEQLQNQINPHFLFNMLNNILVLIRENPEEAVIVLHKLSDMLKYLYKKKKKNEVLLNDDIHFLTDFLNLEKIRRDRFEFSVSIENDAGKLFVPPLLFLPFVENAVKHGNDAVNPSYIRLNFGIKGDFLHFICCNSKPVSPRKKNEYNGLGLINIQRRLELLFDNSHTLDITEDEITYTVQLTIKL
jgi:sensor histidine kinase YesM